MRAALEAELGAHVRRLLACAERLGEMAVRGVETFREMLALAQEVRERRTLGGVDALGPRTLATGASRYRRDGRDAGRTRGVLRLHQPKVLASEDGVTVGIQAVVVAERRAARGAHGGARQAPAHRTIGAIAGRE